MNKRLDEAIRSPFLLRWLLVGLMLAMVLFLAMYFSLPDQNLHLISCDVGQGDATLVVLGSMQVLVDGGPSEAVVGCLSRHIPFWDRSIEVVVLSHPQADHMNGLVAVLQRYEVGEIVMTGTVSTTSEFKAFRQAVREEKANVHLVRRGDVLSIGSLSFDVIWPVKRSGLVSDFLEADEANIVLGRTAVEEDVNETSVVMRMSYGAFDALLTGDIGFDSENELIGDAVLSDVEVLKVGHHGSKYASSLRFLEVVDPEIALISVGERNSFGHPTAETLGRLSQVGSRVFRTDELGDIEIVSDGKGFWVEEL